MFRTRDFILFFTIVIFLVAAIGVTIFNNHMSRTQSATTARVSLQTPVTTEGFTLTASIPAETTVNYLEHRNRLREKISALPPTPTPVIEFSNTDATTEQLQDEDLDVVPTTTVHTPTDPGPVLCAGFGLYPGNWDATQISLEKREGAHVAERSVDGVIEGVLQLPVRFQPDVKTYCVPSDVIGVAFDGSLIRNFEAQLYSVFDSGTVVGYALDGFPIYGGGSFPLDQCGGASVGGQYGYYVNLERQSIVNCFYAPPALLP